MPSREVLIREVLLTDNLTIDIPAPDRETRKVITAIHDGKDERLAYAAGEMSFTATRAETTMSADQQHTMIAAARVIMLELERAGKPIPEASLTAALGQRGFTPADIRDGAKLLRTEKLVARRDGAMHDLTGTEHRAKRRLSPASLAPRTSAAATPASSTTANRPNMPVGALIEHPERVDMGKRMRAQAEQMPSASFEVGDIPAAPAKTTVKKAVPAAPVIPDSAVVAYTESVLDMWARHGKLTARWAELPWNLPTMELPEGVAAADVANHVFYNRLVARGVVRQDGEIFTYVPAEKAVKALSAWVIKDSVEGVLLTAASAAAREDVQALTPSGWGTETIMVLALEAAAEAGVIERVEGGWMKPAPKPEVVEQKPAPKPEAPAPAPAGDTTSSTTAPKPEDAKSETPPAAPVSNTALEKKVDVLTGEVRAIGKRLHTLPAPPSKEQVMLADAIPEARYLLEKILVQLKVKQRLAEEDNKGEQHFAMTRDDLKSRMPGRARVTATNPNPPDYRKHVLAALELGRAMGVIKYTEKWLGGSYVFITHVNVMPRAELDRRVQRVLDIRAARAEKQDAA
ncbi:hypothetical protein [Mycobacteroides abscessus]|uniref:hypothetical protein n=1 Tax=Mycobacteroides abscessus TaxID=36809 RepID=UPI0005E6EFD8|nr:hypothetical protein [Mycobacteroides abscessus]CPW94963.1 Uncharacterised protein [Mycobacteroides abscessus]SKU66978.1 Uncharacterised protein [Mycobacteroides abscessus subsp. abscessus]